MTIGVRRACVMISSSGREKIRPVTVLAVSRRRFWALLGKMLRKREAPPELRPQLSLLCAGGKLEMIPPPRERFFLAIVAVAARGAPKLLRRR